MYRPPSEADAFILQATIGCSWNACTYCNMYRHKDFRVRSIGDVIDEIRRVAASYGNAITKVFVADGDALVMSMDYWRRILRECAQSFPALRRVSAYATALNINDKTAKELRELRDLGLSLLYLGPESGDDTTLKQIAKGSSHQAHVEAATHLHEAGIEQSVIFLLGAGGVKRSAEHATESATLLTKMSPRFASALTLTIVPNTPIAKLADSGRFELPDIGTMLRELRTIVDLARPAGTTFRTNHASNYLSIAGELPADRVAFLEKIDAAISGGGDLRPEWARGL